MEEKKYEAIVEAILFTMGESVELERIAKKIGRASCRERV